MVLNILPSWALAGQFCLCLYKFINFSLLAYATVCVLSEVNSADMTNLLKIIDVIILILH